MLHPKKPICYKLLSIFLSSYLIFPSAISADVLNGITAEELQSDYISDEYISDDEDSLILETEQNEFDYQEQLDSQIDSQENHEEGVQLNTASDTSSEEINISDTSNETYVVVKTDDASLIEAPIVGQYDDLYMLAYPDEETAEKGVEELNNNGAAACVDDYIYMADYEDDDSEYIEDDEVYDEEPVYEYSDDSNSIEYESEEYNLDTYEEADYSSEEYESDDYEITDDVYLTEEITSSEEEYNESADIITDDEINEDENRYSNNTDTTVIDEDTLSDNIQEDSKDSAVSSYVPS